MGCITIVALVAVFAVAYIQRLSLSGVDLWTSVVWHDPESLRGILTRNYFLFFSLYIPLYWLLYQSPFRAFLSQYKLNKKYPPWSLVVKEFARSSRGVAIGSLLESVVHEWTRRGSLPIVDPPTFLDLSRDRTQASLGPILCAIALGYLYGDFHFYWTHRLLHTKALYARVHKFHHESFNPNPFSGLSMHAFESFVYFSSSASISLFVPLWMARMVFIGQIIFPLEGHCGFGSWNHEETVNHYIHHSKFEWNYGSSILWDKIMGTDYTEGNKNHHKFREMAATENARLVGSELGKGLCGEAVPIGTS